MTEGTDVRGPGDALSSDEETCLLILAEGGYMAPIGRWTGPLESLTQRGLAKMLDAANYVVTERGKLIASKKDTEFYTDWINASNKAVERKSAFAGSFVEHRVDPGRSVDEVDDVNAVSPLRFSTPHPIGPNIVQGKLFFGFPDGTSISCDCIGEPYASQIVALWKSR